MSTDMRKYGAQTTRRLIIGALIILLVVGLGLITVIYGFGAALFGLVCLIGMALPIGLVLVSLYGIDRIIAWLDPDRGPK